MTEHADDHMVDFQVLATGLVYASVCTSLGEQDTTDKLNLINPTGTSWRWTPSHDTTFLTGQPNPCPCEKQPNTHHHVLYSC